MRDPWVVLCQYVPARCVPELLFFDTTSLGYCIPDQCVLTLYRMDWLYASKPGILVMPSILMRSRVGTHQSVTQHPRGELSKNFCSGTVLIPKDKDNFQTYLGTPKISCKKSLKIWGLKTVQNSFCIQTWYYTNFKKTGSLFLCINSYGGIDYETYVLGQCWALNTKTTSKLICEPLKFHAKKASRYEDEKLCRISSELLLHPGNVVTLCQ
jgi:hypothetical protein